MRSALSTLFVVLLFTGCGRDSNSVDVSGQVTMNGQPLAGADVTFISDSFAGFGKTDAEGRYELVQGAFAGSNRVVISLIDPSKLPGTGGIQFSDDPEAGLDRGQMDAMLLVGAPNDPRRSTNLTGETIPPDYSDIEKTKLTFVVPEGGSDSADFKLVSQ